jgi:H+/gluconate symporter-like permease
MTLSIGAGSLMCSHVNDTGFWMFKEWFGLGLKETFLSWTLMETLVGLSGLAGVMLLEVVI